MTESFVPLVAAPIFNGEAAMLQLKVLPQAETKPAFEPLLAEQPTKPCAQPSVTLQRQGEIVSGIRIECGCGQVIELVCSY